MDFLSAGWVWLYIGAGLMLAEILAPGFVIFFFGLAAATVGLLVHLLPDPFNPDLTWQVALFSIFSVVYLVTLRRYMKSVFLGDFGGDGRIASEFEGRVGRVTQAIRPGVPGRMMLGDAEWSAVADKDIPAGAEVQVVAQNNLTLNVKEV